MAATSRTPPTWVIDTRGLIEALTTSKNSVRATVIDAIQSGSMLILKCVSAELKEAYPEVYVQLQGISPKKYLTPNVSMIAAAAALAESFGSSLLIGSIPSMSYFEALAAARMSHCALVSFGRGLVHGKAISKKCALPAGSVVSVSTI